MGDRRRLHLLLEGQTEEIVAQDLIKPHLASQGWQVTHSIVTTKRPAAGPSFRGGVRSWASLEREIRRLLSGRSFDVVTTVIDYYGFPPDSPGMADRPTGGCLAQVEHVERALAGVIDDRRFVPHLTLHEIEAWVLAAADELSALYGDGDLARTLERCVADAGGPESVNDGPSTAPSKRLSKYWPTYIKTVDGPLALAELGLPALRSRCPHLDAWLARFDLL
jgi:hypothetical protein